MERRMIVVDRESAADARRCIELLRPNYAQMTEEDRKFFLSEISQASHPYYSPVESQLQWLKDLVERYTTS
jgi:hypothetical protein